MFASRHFSVDYPGSEFLQKSLCNRTTRVQPIARTHQPMRQSRPSRSLFPVVRLGPTGRPFHHLLRIFQGVARAVSEEPDTGRLNEIFAGKHCSHKSTSSHTKVGARSHCVIARGLACRRESVVDEHPGAECKDQPHLRAGRAVLRCR